MNFSDYFEDIFGTMEDDVRKVFGDIKSMVNRPKANILAFDDRYEIHLAVPGIRKEDISIEVGDQGMTVSADLADAADLKYLKREFSFNRFVRKFRIPFDVDREQIKAQYENGVLVLSLHKVTEKKRTVNVD